MAESATTLAQSTEEVLRPPIIDDPTLFLRIPLPQLAHRNIIIPLGMPRYRCYTKAVARRGGIHSENSLGGVSRQEWGKASLSNSIPRLMANIPKGQRNEITLGTHPLIEVVPSIFGRGVLLLFLTIVAQCRSLDRTIFVELGREPAPRRDPLIPIQEKTGSFVYPDGYESLGIPFSFDEGVERSVRSLGNFPCR